VHLEKAGRHRLEKRLPALEKRTEEKPFEHGGFDASWRKQQT